MLRFCCLTLAFLACCAAGVAGQPTKEPAWIPAMRDVHARFKGERGTFAQFGDSITVTMAFWAPLQGGPPKNIDEATQADYELVTKHIHNKCWRDWKGPEFGSEGGMTIRWASENMDAWLKKLKPEIALIMFGTNDLGQLELEEYDAKSREVVQKCLDNGTIVILSTIPPRHGFDDKAEQFAEVVRKIAGDLKVPLCDYMKEITDRRPDDWDGTLDKFKDRAGYDVLTLIAADGVHPSFPHEFQSDFSEEALKTSGYTLRNYLALKSYADVVRNVLAAKDQ